MSRDSCSFLAGPTASNAGAMEKVGALGLVDRAAGDAWNLIAQAQAWGFRLVSPAEGPFKIKCTRA